MVNYNVTEPKEVPVFKIVAIGLFLLVGLIVLFGSWYTIDAGERGVLLTWGRASEVPITSGLHFKIPIAQDVIKIDVRTKKYEVDASSASKDLQTVSTKIAVNYNLQPDSVVLLYKETGLDFENRIIVPAVQEVVKASTAKFTAEELITRRQEVKDLIKLALAERLDDKSVVVEDISITNFDFSASFNQAIEAKVTSTQLKLKADQDLERIKVEAEQRITQAKGESEAIKIQAQAINAQGGADYVKLQAINKWNGALPGVTSGVVPFINVGGN